MVGASPNASNMKVNLLTVGQIAKKHQVALEDVYGWCSAVRKLFDVWGRSWGIIYIDEDPYHRKGMPEEIVNLYPNLPTPELIDKYTPQVKKL